MSHSWGLGSGWGLYFPGNLWGLGVPLEAGIPLVPCHALPPPFPQEDPSGTFVQLRLGLAQTACRKRAPQRHCRVVENRVRGHLGTVLGCPCSLGHIPACSHLPGAHTSLFPSPLGTPWSAAPSLRTHSKLSPSLGAHLWGVPLPWGTSCSPYRAPSLNVSHPLGPSLNVPHRLVPIPGCSPSLDAHP